MISPIWTPLRRVNSFVRLVTSIAALSTLIACTSGPTVAFQGTELTGNNKATSFHLVNQFGTQVSLQNFSDKVVALTFLYTNCLDTCPLTAKILNNTYQALGTAVDEVAFLVITADPTRDTVERIHEYSQERDMLNKWSYLTGSLADLQQVWEDYYVPIEPYQVSTGGAQERLSHAAIAAAVESGDLRQYLIGHPAPVYLIDRSGVLRVLHSDVTYGAKALTDDLRLLIAETA